MFLLQRLGIKNIMYWCQAEIEFGFYKFSNITGTHGYIYKRMPIVSVYQRRACYQSVYVLTQCKLVFHHGRKSIDVLTQYKGELVLV